MLQHVFDNLCEVTVDNLMDFVFCNSYSVFCFDNLMDFDEFFSDRTLADLGAVDEIVWSLLLAVCLSGIQRKGNSSKSL